MDEETAEQFSRVGMITEPVKKYLIERRFTTLEALKVIPTNDLQSMTEYLSGCPDLKSFPVRRALYCLLDEIKNPGTWHIQRNAKVQNDSSNSKPC
jgi:hypothetical protein